MREKPGCRLHGGKGGGPRGERSGAYRTGHYTAEAKDERRQLWAVLRALRRLKSQSEDYSTPSTASLGWISGYQARMVVGIMLCAGRECRLT
jgi:hypothetical protein